MPWLRYWLRNCLPLPPWYRFPGVSGLFGLLIVQPGNQVFYLLAMLLAYAAGFALTWFFGVDEDRINDVFGE